MQSRACSVYILSVAFLVTISMGSSLRADDKKSIIEVRMEATVCIGTVQKVQLASSAKPTNTFVPCGTGAIIGIPDDPGKRVCLVTANHVFDLPEKNWHPEIINLRFTWNQHLPLDKYHGLAIKIRDKKQKNWIRHSEADLAAIPLFIPSKVVGKSSVSAITLAQFSPLENLALGQPVTILGFPGAVRGSLGSSFMTLPLVRHGIISWLPSSKDMPRAILVDTMAFPGNSGGPVFNEPRRWDEYGNVINKPQHSQFVGIVSKAAIQPVELKAVKISGASAGVFKPLSLDYMGLAQVEPADRVKELLDKVSKTLVKETEQKNSPDKK